ncbi:hypothetical protein, partial [Gluconobacter cerinus]|uniref:hypothetical protein n=1 Tax=Gluconobacter cerinus TaxID=38307 RepID=UPI0039EC6E08
FFLCHPPGCQLFFTIGKFNHILAPQNSVSISITRFCKQSEWSHILLNSPFYTGLVALAASDRILQISKKF